ncbi:MAG: histidine triad nucleotide-binding protein [Clostridia bacterium]
MDCIFCKIINGEIPSKKVYENDFVFAFYDIEPHAPIHILIVPKCHTESVLTLNIDEYNYISEMFKAAKLIANDLHLEKNGFRLVLNTGSDGGQTVMHIHMHLLAGKKFLDF